MRTLLLICLLSFPFTCFAVQKVYWGNDTMITDISGNKTIEQIKLEFGDTDYQVIEIDESFECPIIENGKLKKKNFVKEAKEKQEQEDIENKVKEGKI